jgi:hypothetical protein
MQPTHQKPDLKVVDDKKTGIFFGGKMFKFAL